MTKNRFLKASILSTTMIFGGCASYSHTDTNTCNQWKDNRIGIPKVLEIFKGKTSAVHSELCETGLRIGYSALAGRKPDGTLQPASIIMWHNQYSDLLNKINKTQPDMAWSMIETKKFADYFIQEGSQGQISSEMVLGMYQYKKTDPTLFSFDGKYTPPSLTPNTKNCQGDSLVLVCD